MVLYPFKWLHFPWGSSPWLCVCNCGCQSLLCNLPYNLAYSCIVQLRWTPGSAHDTDHVDTEHLAMAIHIHLLLILLSFRLP